MLARLRSTPIEAVFTQGLHEFIEEFVAENNRLGAAIRQQYLT
jgi:uncharacterized alpha-E superfamily protein